MKRATSTSKPRLEPFSYPVDKENVRWQKRKNAFRNMIAAYAMTFAGMGAALFAHFAANDSQGTWVAVGWAVTTALLAAWGSYSYYKRSRYGYKVLEGRVTVEFDNEEYFVPEHIMEPFLTGITIAFEPFFQKRYQRSVLQTLQSRLVVLKERPEDPLKRVAADRVVGVTYHQWRTSYVYGPYALNDGGLGYEFRLQLCKYIIPNTSEQEKIDWMAENGIYG